MTTKCELRQLTIEEEIVATLLELEGYKILRGEQTFADGEIYSFLAINPNTKTAVPVLLSGKQLDGPGPYQLWDLDPNGSDMQIGDFVANKRLELEQSCKVVALGIGEDVEKVTPLVVGFYSTLKADHKWYALSINSEDDSDRLWEESADAEGFYREDLISNRTDLHNFEFWDLSDINAGIDDYRGVEPLESLVNQMSRFRD